MFNAPSLKTFILLSTGILIGKFTFFSLSVSYLIFLLLLLILIFFRHLQFFTLEFQTILLCFAVVLCGICHYQTYHYITALNPSFTVIKENHPLKVKGHLITDPHDRRNNYEYTLKTDQLMYQEQTFRLDAVFLIKDYKKISKNLTYGEQVILKGIIKKPRNLRNPGGFNYRKYLAHKNIFYIFYPDTIRKENQIKKGNIILREIVYPVRRFMIASIERLFPRPSSRSVIKALILGDKGNISDKIVDSFSKTGIIHVLAVSGLHVGFILIIFMTLFDLFRINPVVSSVLTILVLLFYVLLTESHPPVFRAAVMSSLYLISVNLHRKTQSFNIIGTAGILLLIINPNNLFSLSFILSFSAISSILYFYNKLISFSPFLKLKKRTPALAKISAAVFVSFSALIGTLPISAYYYNRIPLFSIVINSFAIPLTGLIVVLGFITIFFSSFSLYVASIYAGLTDILVSAFIAGISWFSHRNFSHITVPSPSGLMMVFYYLLLFFIFNFTTKYKKLFLFLLLFSLNVLIWKSVLSKNSTDIKWIQFDVGQGDSALLITPTQKTVLIDGGPRSDFFDSGKQVIAPYLHKKGIKKINYIILTHPHGDHVGGLLYIVKNFSIDRIYYTDCPCSTSIYLRFMSLAKQKNIALYNVTAPDSLILSYGKMYFLAPSENNKSITKNFHFNVNNQSLVSCFLFGQTKFLFMGDAEEEVEKEIIRTYNLLQCNILKTGHHGSSTSSSFPFLQQIDPEIAIISVGKNNRFHLPSRLVLDYLQLLDISTHRTDEQGAAVFKTDGKTIRQIDWR